MRAAAITVLLLGCASAPPPEATSPAGLDAALGSWVAGEEASGSRVLRRDDPRRGPVRVTQPRDTTALPHGRPIDVRFERAPLTSALLLLAEQADLGLVVGEGVEGSVSASLSRVRPLQAMRALAEAHGVELTFVGRTVIARASRPR